MSTASLLRIAFFALVLIQSGSTTAAAQTASPYRITGTVVNSLNGAPIPHCRLTATLNNQARAMGNRRSLASQNSQTPPDSFNADEHGNFTIPLPSSGLWSLVASARGFVTQAYDEHQQFSSAIVLTPENPAINLHFKLPPEATITGVVIDEAGEPIRNAHLSLLTVPPTGPDLRPLPMGTRSVTQTDDRGIYEFANIVPGDYRITLQAQPWYATTAQPRQFSRPAVGSASTPQQLDPSLDLTYPLTWFPGVDDPALAETLTIHGGDTRQADFHLVPIPSIHLHIVPPPSPPTADGRPPNPSFPTVERVNQSGGGFPFQPVSVNSYQQGQFDVSGLSPGLYQVRLQGQGPGSGSESRTTLVEVTAGSVQTVNFGASPSFANITVRFDGLDDTEGDPVQVRLIDADTGQPAPLPPNIGVGMNGGSPGNLRQRRQPGTPSPDRVLQVPPGRYEVTLFGKPDIYLTGITAQSAEVTGRIIKVHVGDASMTLHTATGRATLTGVATFADKPSVGAIALLVPASLGDPTGIAILRRDQTNTDGSFEFADVIPGQYILVVIDNGWHINWSDPSTLRGYLLHGVPVDLSTSANVRQNITAQAP
jgi:hypothetical protein